VSRGGDLSIAELCDADELIKRMLHFDGGAMSCCRASGGGSTMVESMLGGDMRRLAFAVVGLMLATLVSAPADAAPLWKSSVSATNTVVSRPVDGGGYPVPPGQTAPDPGTCRAGSTTRTSRSPGWP
jgi:hypothetical protein